MVNKFISRFSVAVATLSLVAGVALPNAVGATKPDESGHKVTICHRTNSVKNPYVQITIDYAAVDGQGKNDHSHHSGPVATSEAVAQGLKDSKTKWGDIIPPVEGVTGGLNWTGAGQALYRNNCDYVTAQDGGQGGQVLGAQTQAPKGAVSAGAGGAVASSVGSIFGLLGSAVTAGAGFVARRKWNV